MKTKISNYLNWPISSKNTSLDQLPDYVEDEEYLYRRIEIDQYYPSEKRVSSVAFRDSDGTSVDRDFKRSLEECIKGVIKNGEPYYCIVRITAGSARSTKALVNYKWLINNLYHSEISDETPTKKQIRKTIAAKLADLCSEPVYINPNKS